MIDEVDIYSRLESALFGSLVHAVGVSALVVAADASAIRLFEGPNGALSTFVNTSSLGLNGDVSPALQQWPNTEESIFEFARRKRLNDDSFRPRDLLDDSEGDPTHFFLPFESFRTVTDAYCITFPVVAPAWCMIAYLRCVPSGPFENHHIEMLRRFKPALARVTQGGYHREIHGLTAATDRRATITVAKMADNTKTAELMAKLSRTERLILSFLRSDSTERQIAQTIHRSPHTIHVHVKNIYRKLGVNSRRMLTALFEIDS